MFSDGITLDVVESAEDDLLNVKASGVIGEDKSNPIVIQRMEGKGSEQMCGKWKAHGRVLAATDCGGRLRGG